MSYTLSILATAMTVLVGMSGNAFAGIPATSVPEPATLTLLAIGFGGAAAVKYFKRK
ncbi:MAG: PEP-CTERM sorting domain-containing protein [Stellaceae bacterium]